MQLVSLILFLGYVNMKFTIEVKKKEKDEEFSFKDLEMFHQECCGGKIRKKQYYHGIGRLSEDKLENPLDINDSAYDNFVPGWELTCQKCGVIKLILADPQGINIIKTAIDGEERNIKNNIRVIQKI